MDEFLTIQEDNEKYIYIDKDGNTQALIDYSVHCEPFPSGILEMKSNSR